jgi:hypothetical protein
MGPDAFLNLIDLKSDDGACINEEEAIVILLNILRVSTYLHRDAFICIMVRDPIIKQGVFGKYVLTLKILSKITMASSSLIHAPSSDFKSIRLRNASVHSFSNTPLNCSPIFMG